MTNEELTAAQARLTEADTELAALDQAIRECIDKAREFNAARKVAEGKRHALLAAIEPTRTAIAEHIREAKRRQAEEAKARAEAEQSELAKAQAKITELEAALAAKGE